MTKWKAECNTFFDKNIKGEEILDIGRGAYPHPKATKTLDAFEEVHVRENIFRPDIVADINEHIPLSDNSVDCIIMNNVLEHIHTPQKAIDECRRVLKEEGLLLVAVPFLIKIHQEPIDFHRYTRYMLEKLFKDFEYTITPSMCTLTDFYIGIQGDLFGQIRKKKAPIGFVASGLIKRLTSLIPDIYEKSYSSGYLIYAKK
jgi:SAM-dependent methyltransferase